MGNKTNTICYYGKEDGGSYLSSLVQKKLNDEEDYDAGVERIKREA